MVRRWLLVPLLITVLAAALPAAGPAAAEPEPPAPVNAAGHPGTTALGDFMGMVVRDPHYEWKTNAAYAGTNYAFYDEMGQNLAAAGVKWVRLEIFAEEFAPLEGQPDLRGRVNVEKYRYFINEVAPKHGLKVLALLATPLVRQRPAGDPAYFPDAPGDPNDTYAEGAYIHPENLEDPLTVKVDDPRIGFVNPYMRIWLENAFQVVQAFPYDKTTGAGIAAYEVLNEENRYLGGGGKGLAPEAVVTMLTKFYRALKSGYPETVADASRTNTKVILGGLHPDRCADCVKQDGTGGMTDREYLNAIYTAKATPKDELSIFQAFRENYGTYPIDGVGYHPYAAEMRSALVPEETAINDLYRVPTRMDAIRAVMLENNDAGNKLWVTEVGDRGAPLGVDPAGDNERRQAKFMRDIYRILSQRQAFIENVFWFKYEDFAVVSGTENWGVVRLVPRPADQLCSQDVPVERQSCEYDQEGMVQRFKESYQAYKEIAARGFSFHFTYLPVITE